MSAKCLACDNGKRLPKGWKCDVCGRRTHDSVRRFVMLRCPKCKKTIRSPRLASDPPKTYEVRMTCHECQNGGYDDTSYHDKSGKEIAQHNKQITKT